MVAKKTAAKPVETKAPAKAAPAAKAEVKEEVKAAPAAKAEVKAEAKPAAKAEVKEEVKAEAPAKKAPAKKAPAKKAEPKTDVFFEYEDKMIEAKKILAKAEKAFAKNHKDVEIKTLQLYVNGNDGYAYLVVNGDEYPDDKIAL